MTAKKPAFAKELAALATVLEALTELDPETQAFVVRTACSRLGLDSERGNIGGKTNGREESSERNGGGVSPAGRESRTVPRNAKEFLKEKKADSDVQRIAVLAYYLNNYLDMESFDAKDLIKLNTDAGGQRITNPHRALDNASRGAGFLTTMPGRKKKISAHGEEVVEALPDKEEVKRIQAEQKTARRRGKPKRTSATKKNTKK